MFLVAMIQIALMGVNGWQMAIHIVFTARGACLPHIEWFRIFLLQFSLSLQTPAALPAISEGPEVLPLTAISPHRAPRLLALLLNIHCVWESFLHRPHWFPWERSVGSGMDGVAVCPGTRAHPESRLKSWDRGGRLQHPVSLRSPSERSHYRHHSFSGLQ